MTAYPKLHNAIEAMRLGAIDFIHREGEDQGLKLLAQRARQALRLRPSKRAPSFHRENLIHFFYQSISKSGGKGHLSDGQLVPGLALEYLVKLLLESCEGFEIVWHRVTTSDEELDLVCLNGVQHGFWGKQGSLILVECKDYIRQKPEAKDRRNFEAKIQNRLGQATIGIFVSSSGFPQTFYRQAIVPVPGGALPIIIPLDLQDLEAWLLSFDRLAWLTEKAMRSLFR